MDKLRPLKIELSSKQTISHDTLKMSAVVASGWNVLKYVGIF